MVSEDARVIRPMRDWGKYLEPEEVPFTTDIPPGPAQTIGRIIGIKETFTIWPDTCSIEVQSRDTEGRLQFMGTFGGVTCSEVHVGDRWVINHGPWGSASGYPEGDADGK